MTIDSLILKLPLSVLLYIFMNVLDRGRVPNPIALKPRDRKTIPTADFHNKNNESHCENLLDSLTGSVSHNWR